MSSEQERPRRNSFVEHEAVYAAAGASAAADLMRFPPEGSTPFAAERKLGSGADRFLLATNLLMTWGMHRGSGLEVIDIQQDDRDRYAGITFTDQGLPEASPEPDVRYGPDGEAFLTAGTTATLCWPGGKVSRKMRVVFVTDEPRMAGFALGSADSSGAVGETAYMVEHRSDDSVWATAQGFFWAPSQGLLGIKARAVIRLAIKDATQQLAALVPGAIAATGSGTDASDSEE